MTGIGEEGVKVVGNFIDALKAQPAVLALIVVTFALVGFVYYQGASFEAARRANVESVIKMQAELAKLITQCVQPSPTP